MDISFALTGKGYVIVAADTTAARSIVKMKIDEDKIKVLSPHLLMAYSGEPGMLPVVLKLSFAFDRLFGVNLIRRHCAVRRVRRA